MEEQEKSLTLILTSCWFATSCSDSVACLLKTQYKTFQCINPLHLEILDIIPPVCTNSSNRFLKKYFFLREEENNKRQEKTFSVFISRLIQ